ncbi:MAG: hypothetical protein IJ195_01005 [Lachnospiraceae bacterium]|nr:hypothetical protein [Lachnospiraceae bacterium]
MSKYADGLKLGNIEGTFMRDFFALCRQGKQAVLDFLNDPEGGIAINQYDILSELIDFKVEVGEGKITDVDIETFCHGLPLDVAFSDEIADLKQGRINRDLAKQDAEAAAREKAVMKEDQKQIEYLNVCMDKTLYEEFESFCKDMGISKVDATENAIRQYMDKMRKE